MGKLVDEYSGDAGFRFKWSTDTICDLMEIYLSVITRTNSISEPGVCSSSAALAEGIGETLRCLG